MKKIDAFVDKLFDNVGGKIKGLARVLLILGTVISVLAGFILVAGDFATIGIPVLLLGPLLSLISAWFLYGFGEIVENTSAINRNTAE